MFKGSTNELQLERADAKASNNNQLIITTWPALRARGLKTLNVLELLLLLLSIIGQLGRLTGVAVSRTVAILVASGLAILRAGSIGRAVMASWGERGVLLF